MSETFGDRLRAAFDELLAVEATDRTGFIRRRFPDDEHLRRELLQMTRHLDSKSAFLEPPDATEVRALLGKSTEGSGWPDEQLPDFAGMRLAGRYELGRRLGAGGQSVVHEATDILQDAPVAVKVLRDVGPRSRLALRREAAALRLLRLPGVVQLFDEGVEAGLAFLVTERVEGRPFPGPEGPVPWEDLRSTTTALLETLERMHRFGIVHGDLKPGNVLVRSDGVPVILDLGIAEGPRAAPRQERLGMARGTLRYIAPEQAERATVTARSDLYAVGVMLYEALAGTAYRSTDTLQLLRIGVAGERGKPLTEVAPGAPPFVRDGIERLLAYAPEARPASAAETLRLLDRDAPRRRRRLAFLEDARGPLSATQLRAAFAGPDRLLHVPEDAAAELHRRTGGEPDAVVDELEAWSRAGHGWFEGERYHIRRTELERLRRGGCVLTPARAVVDLDQELNDTDLELLLTAELAGPRATPALLAAALDRGRTEVEASLRALAAHGTVRESDDGSVVVVGLPAGSRERMGERSADLHRQLAMALPPGDACRLLHWAAAGQMDVVPAESIAVAERLLQEGDVGNARVAVQEGLSAVAVRPDPPWTIKLLELGLQAALQLGTKQALDEYLHLLERQPPNPRLERLEGIAKGSLHVMNGQPARALEEIPAPEDAPSDADRRGTVSVRLFAARFLGSETLERELQRAERLAAEEPSRALRATVASTRAWALYAAERYEEAGRLHLEAAEAMPSPAARALALLNAASAFLEAGELDRAEALAEEARTLARDLRHALSEARAERVLRAAIYRRGDALVPDRELVEASRELGNPNVTGLVALGEAAVAWRADRPEIAIELADLAVDSWRGEGERWPRLLARALAVAAGAPAEAREAERLLEECEACPQPGVALQAAALLARAASPSTAGFRGVVAARLGAFPLQHRHIRLEVLAPEEAMK